MVSNSILTAFCVEMGFHKFLIHDNHPLSVTISEYVEKIANAKANEESASRRERRPMGQYWSDIETPKVSRLPVVQLPL